MTLFALAYLAGVLTIATPCIFPILPFVLARTDEPFRRGGLPMLFGLAVAFAAVASLASVAGGWAVEANRYGRIAALALMTLFGLAMLLPVLAARMATPLVSIGARLLNWADRRRAAAGATAASSMLLGIATGLVWTPCAGPALGLILTGAALRGPSVETSLLLLAYGVGAASSLAAGLLLGKRLLSLVKSSIRWGGGLRRILGAAVVAGVVTIWLGLDARLPISWSSVRTDSIEQDLIDILRDGSALAIGSPAHAAPAPASSAPLLALLSARQWRNTPPLRPEALRGKVVLVNFWTYSCINCLRALPHVRAWAEKYKDRGLVVVGVQTPEFAFEKDVANVSKALALLGVSYPVAIDNDFRIWRAFNNEAWPAFYFIDAGGQVRHAVVGEGDYDQSERLIQQLLSEAAGKPAIGPILDINGEGRQAAADLRDLRSTETYIGYAQASNFASPGGISEGVPMLYQPAPALPLNRWGLSGIWSIGPEFATLDGQFGRISYRFHARDLHLVLARSAQSRPIDFRIRIDGAPPGANHGSDVDAEGWGTVREDRLYQLVRQTGPITDRTFEIEFFDAGVRAYVFTFG